MSILRRHSLLYSIVSVLTMLLILTTPLWLWPYAIRGSSMYPTLMKNDVVMVDTFTLHVRGPQRGELLIFRNPHRKRDGDAIEVDIKRVIGLPGETVHVRKDKVVINRACDEYGASRSPERVDIQQNDGPCQITYTADTFFGGGTYHDNVNEFDMFLGPLDYFVLGDNRGDSSDSRKFGAVQPENFIGRPIIRILPLPRFSVLSLERFTTI